MSGRSDERTLARLWRNGEVFKWAMLLLAVANAVLAVTCILIAKRPVQTVAVMPDGQTLMTNSVGDEMRQNQAKHDTREFLEALHSKDAILGPSARKKAVWYMAPNLQTEIGKSVSDSVLLTNMVASKAQSRIEWDIPPKIVSWNYPGARVYASFVVVTRGADGVEVREKHNVSVDGAFFASTESRPSGYLITRFKYVTDVRELNQILNQIGG